MINLNKNIITKSSSVKLDSVIDASLKFRKMVRNLALNKNQSLPKEVKVEILKNCDQFREDFNKLNIEFKVNLKNNIKNKEINKICF